MKAYIYLPSLLLCTVLTLHVQAQDAVSHVSTSGFASKALEIGVGDSIAILESSSLKIAGQDDVGFGREVEYAYFDVRSKLPVEVKDIAVSEKGDLYALTGMVGECDIVYSDSFTLSVLKNGALEPIVQLSGEQGTFGKLLVRDEVIYIVEVSNYLPEFENTLKDSISFYRVDLNAPDAFLSETYSLPIEGFSLELQFGYDGSEDELFLCTTTK